MRRPWSLNQCRERLLTVAIVYIITIVTRMPSIPQYDGISLIVPGESAGKRSAVSAVRRTTFLLGIFCQLNDTKHRQMTRATMLGPDLPEDVKARVCSLQDYLDDIRVASTCQILYTFVVGGNPSAPAAYPEGATDLVVENSTLSVLEPDVVLLNIQENMNKGKTPSWFHYTSIILHRKIDYVSKLDLDTLVSIPQLLAFVNNELPPVGQLQQRAPPRVYGGLLMDFEACGGKFYESRCKPVKGKVYMSGQFYFVSYDLVQHQSLWRTNDTFKERKYEDLSFGIRIWAYPHPIKLIAFNPHMFWWHGYKNETLWMDGYNAMKASGWNISESYLVNSLFKEPPIVQIQGSK